MILGYVSYQKISLDISVQLISVMYGYIWMISIVTKVICHPDIFTLASLPFATLRKSNK